jgi:hypothetical protein
MSECRGKALVDIECGKEAWWCLSRAARDGLRQRRVNRVFVIDGRGARKLHGEAIAAVHARAESGGPVLSAVDGAELALSLTQHDGGALGTFAAEEFATMLKEDRRTKRPVSIIRGGLEAFRVKSVTVLVT